jgi:hypothetical protein
MVHGGHAPAGERAVQRVAGALAFHDGDELLLILLEAAQDGIGDLAVHFDVPVAGKGEGVGRFGGAGAGEMGIMGVMRVRRANRAGVAEQAAEDVGEEVREQGGFLELVGATGGDEAGPVFEFGLSGGGLLGQDERPHLLAQDFRVEERFGFEGHLPGDSVSGVGRKPSAFVLTR